MATWTLPIGGRRKDLNSGHNRQSAKFIAWSLLSLRKIETVAGRLGIWDSLQPWHSFLHRVAGLASMSLCCLAQHSNFVLGHGPELLSLAPLRCRVREKAPRTVEDGCTLTNIRVYGLGSCSIWVLSTNSKRLLDSGRSSWQLECRKLSAIQDTQ